MQLWKLRRRIHISWVLTLAFAGFVVGVYTSQYSQIFAGFYWILFGFLLLAVGCWRRSMYLLPAVLVAAMVIGLWRGSVLQVELRAYEGLYDRIVTVEGSVAADPEAGKQGLLVIKLGEIRIGESTFPGKLWITTDTQQPVYRGDKMVLKGKLVEGFGTFAGTIYRAQVISIIQPQPGDVARVVRDWFADAVRQAIPEPQASLGIGYLVGQKSALPADLEEALQIAGLTHIVVASGYNLTILVRLARRLFVKVSKYLSALSSSIMIFCFMAVTGLSPSMSRAELVAGLSLAAWYYGRRFHPLVLLSFAAALTVAIEPSFVWDDLGWQLSFAAFGGVMIVAPLLQRYFFGDKKPRIMRQILGETISAHIVTAPIIILAFSQLSNVAIIANVMILPFVPLAMLLTFISGIGALIIPTAAEIIGLPATWLLEYMTTVTYYLADLPWASTKLEITWPIVAIAYAMIIAGCIYLWRATHYNLRDSNIVE